MDIAEIVEMNRYHMNWFFCHYELIDSIDSRQQNYQYLEYLAGQGKFICNNHQMPLTVNPKQNNNQCSIDKSCNEKLNGSAHLMTVLLQFVKTISEHLVLTEAAFS